MQTILDERVQEVCTVEQVGSGKLTGMSGPSCEKRVKVR